MAKAEKAAYDREYRRKNYERVAASKAEYYRTHTEERSAYHATWRENNKEKQAAYDRVYRFANFDRLKAQKLAYIEANKELVARRRNAYYRRHVQHHAEKTKKWGALNPDRRKAISRKWYENNQERYRIYRLNRIARVKGVEGSFTADDIADLRKLQRGRCAYCRRRLPKPFDIDHILPLTRGGSNDRRNLQLTCGTCNRRKWAFHPLDFARKLGRLV
jgi:5-methylcytosine-specific restriction endonuclease McrA